MHLHFLFLETKSEASKPRTIGAPHPLRLQEILRQELSGGGNRRKQGRHMSENLKARLPWWSRG